MTENTRTPRKPETRYRAKERGQPADQKPRWVVRPGMFPFDPPGTARLTGLPELAALFPDRAAALATGHLPEPVLWDPATGEVKTP